MRNWFSKSVAGILMGTFLTQLASAHPGHLPTDVAATISQPFAGPEHFMAFVALTSVLLVGLRFAMKARSVQRSR